MHILISNDDGFEAPGILALVEAFEQQHHLVTMVAPRENKSGCGMGISLRKTVKVEEIAPRQFVVDGTPADCVYIGVNNLVQEPVDLVISGINNGPNLADDVLYSGTFAAAMEARRMSLPALAISITERDVKHYETAVYVALQMANALPHLEYRSLLAVLNVNLPDIPVAQLRGLRATVLGEREAPEAPEKQSQNGAVSNYILGKAGDFRRIKRSKPQDFEAVSNGYASVTPLSASFDDSAYVDDVQKWLDEL